MTDVAKMIDHTLLKPEATIADVAKLVEDAKELGTYSVCVSRPMLPPEDIELGDVKLCVVVGFPRAPSPPRSKLLRLRVYRGGRR